jgi:hypothetical protein
MGKESGLVVENSVEPDWMTFQDGFAFLLESREKFESSLSALKRR